MKNYQEVKAEIHFLNKRFYGIFNLIIIISLIKSNQNWSFHMPKELTSEQRTQKVWFITGCSTGFGRELAIYAIEIGYKVVVTARNPIHIENIVKVMKVKNCI
jgi:hypothetical protein